MTRYEDWQRSLEKSEESFAQKKDKLCKAAVAIKEALNEYLGKRVCYFYHLRSDRYNKLTLEESLEWSALDSDDLVEPGGFGAEVGLGIRVKLSSGFKYHSHALQLAIVSAEDVASRLTEGECPNPFKPGTMMFRKANPIAGVSVEDAAAGRVVWVHSMTETFLVFDGNVMKFSDDLNKEQFLSSFVPSSLRAPSKPDEGGLPPADA